MATFNKFDFPALSETTEFKQLSTGVPTCKSVWQYSQIQDYTEISKSRSGGVRRIMHPPHAINTIRVVPTWQIEYDMEQKLIADKYHTKNWFPTTFAPVCALCRRTNCAGFKLRTPAKEEAMQRLETLSLDKVEYGSWKSYKNCKLIKSRVNQIRSDLFFCSDSGLSYQRESFICPNPFALLKEEGNSASFSEKDQSRLDYKLKYAVRHNKYRRWTKTRALHQHYLKTAMYMARRRFVVKELAKLFVSPKQKLTRHVERFSHVVDFSYCAPFSFVKTSPTYSFRDCFLDPPSRRMSRLTLSKMLFYRELYGATIRGLPPYLIKHLLAYGEMENSEGAQGEKFASNIEKTSNVAMSDQRDVSEGQIVPFEANTYCDMSAMENTVTESTFNDRWQTVTTGKWNSSATMHSDLEKISFPQTVLEHFSDSPNMAIFRQHAYWKGDMEIKFLVNSNARMYGQLQIIFLYGDEPDRTYPCRTYAYTTSQSLHALVSANASNSAILKIPFQYNSAYLSIVPTSRGKFSKSTLGTLIVRVIVPLKAIPTSAQSASYNIAVRFLNNRFAGMISRSLIEAEMFSTIAALAAAKMIGDSNRDNPPGERLCLPVIPSNTGSWCAGDGIKDWTNTLRLQPNAFLPYGVGRVPSVDEMSISYLSSIYGLIVTFPWTAAHHDHTLLKSFDASPIFRDVKRYVSWARVDPATHSANKVYHIPPIAMLSSLYSYWRGDLELRFDVIAATELTGRLMVAYIPRISGLVSFDLAIQSAHAIYDLQENRQFVFRVPYVSPTPFSPIPHFIGEPQSTRGSAPLGSIYVFVYSALVANATIPSECQIVVYLRGADNFEVSVPASPIYASSTDFTVQNYIDHIPHYVYVPSADPPWEYLFKGEGSIWAGKATLLWSRAGTSEDWTHVRYSDASLENKVLKFRYPGNRSWITYFVEILEAGKPIKKFYDLEIIYYVMIHHVNGTQDNCLAPFKSYDSASKYCDLVDKRDTFFIDPATVTNSRFYISDPNDSLDFIIAEKPSNYAVGEAGDERSENTSSDAISIIPSVISTSFGQRVIGESFQDLKSLCRRFQLYWSGSVSMEHPSYGDHIVQLRIPVIPSGLKLSTTSTGGVRQFWNRMREGPISFVASGYKFFSGGLRFRLIFKAVNHEVLESARYFVQHRPNTNITEARSSSTFDWNDSAYYQMSGLAYIIQTGKLNSVITFEIPYYKPFLKINSFPYLSESDINDCSLGEIAIGFSNLRQDVKIHMDLYYCLADDARFSVFQGFLPALPLYDIVVSVPKPRTLAVLPLYPSLDEVAAEGQMDNAEGEMFSIVKNVFGAAKTLSDMDVDTANAAIENLSQIDAGHINEAITKISGAASSISSLVDGKGDDQKSKILYHGLFSQVIHCFINPNPATISWAIVTFLSQVGLLHFSDMPSIMKAQENFLKFKLKFSSAPSEHNEGVAYAEMDEDPVTASFISSLVGGLASAMGITFGGKTPGKTWADILNKGLTTFSNTSNSFFVFFKNNMELIHVMVNWLMGKSVEFGPIAFLKTFDEEIYEWAKDCIRLCDVCYETEIFSNMNLSSRVFDRASQASVIQLQLLHIKIEPQQSIVIRGLISGIMKLRDRLARLHIAPPVKFVPFCYYLHGDPGIGKSYLLQLIPMLLLNAIDYRSFGEIIYNRMPGNSFWNSLANQPVLSYDDWFAVNSSEFGMIQIAELFHVKSNAVFNPPMAAIEDKNVRYNPYIIQMAANSAFPPFTGVLDPVAIYRRRDNLIEVSLKEEYEEVPMREIPKEILKRFGHLRFRFANNPSDTNTNYEDYVDYDTFIRTLIDNFVSYFQKEQLNYSYFLKIYNSLVPSDTEVVFDPGYKAPWQDFDKTFKNGSELSIFAHNNKEPIFITYLNFLKNKCKNLFNSDSTELQGEMTLPSTSKTTDEIDYVSNIFNIFGASCIHKFFRDCALLDFCEFFWTEHRFYARITDKQLARLECLVLKADSGSKDIVNFEGNVTYDCQNQLLSGPDNDDQCTNCLFSKRVEIRQVIHNMLNNNCYLKVYYAAGKTEELVGCVPDWFLATFLKDPLVKIQLLDPKNNFFRKIYLKVVPFFWRVWDWVCKTSKYLFAIFSVMFCGIGVWGYIRSRPEAKEAESFHAHVYGKAVSKKELKTPILNVSAFAKPVGQMSEQEEITVIKALKRNTFLLVAGNGELISSGRCLGIFGRYALIAHHYYEAWSNFCIKYKQDKLMYYDATYPIGISLSFSELNYAPFEDRSLGILRLPLRIPAFRDIRKRFAKKKDHDYVNGQGRVACFKFESEIVTLESISLNFDYRYSMTVQSSSLFQGFDTGPTYVYNFQGRGNCGSILLSSNLPNPIIGFHVAGVPGGCGFSTIVYREMFDQLNSEVDVINQASSSDLVIQGESIDLGEISDCRLYLSNQVLGIGKLPNRLMCHVPSKSRIRPSIIKNDPDSGFECFNDIAVLSPNDPRIADAPFSPLLEGCKFHGNPLDMFDPSDLLESYRDLNNKILSNCKPQRIGVKKLTKLEACAGLPHLERYKSLEWRTSEGFPWCKMRPPGYTNKKWLFKFNDQETCIGLSQVLVDQCKLDKSLRLGNIIPSTIVVDCLKDTVVSKDKCLLPGKTRIFSIAPVHFTIQERQYTMDFVAAYMECRLDLEHTVGINPDGPEWGDLVRRLNFVDDNVISGDYSKFGDTVPAEFIYYIHEIIINWYQHNGCVDAKMFQSLRVMVNEIANSKHLMKNFLYQSLCGHPSGDSMTVIYNSLANSLYFRLGWLHIMKHTKFSALSDFHKHVVLYSNGDDALVGLSNEICSLFNAISLSSFFSLVGLKFTNSSKEDNIVPFDFLRNSEFLKRGFIPHPTRFRLGMYLAPLLKSSIEDTVNWVWEAGFNSTALGSETYLNACLVVCEASLSNAFSRGPNYYTNYKNKLEKYWNSKSVFVSYATWEQIDKRVFDLGELINQYHV